MLQEADLFVHYRDGQGYSHCSGSVDSEEFRKAHEYANNFPRLLGRVRVRAQTSRISLILSSSSLEQVSLPSPWPVDQHLFALYHIPVALTATTVNITFPFPGLPSIFSRPEDGNGNL